MENTTHIENIPDFSSLTTIYVISTAIVSVGMVGVGCTIDYKMLLRYFKQPKPYIIGVLLQVIMLPSLSWAFILLFGMDPLSDGFGVFVQGSCPGGAISNFIIYYLDGAVDLSVALTVTTTVIAMGSMPLWLFIYETANGGVDFGFSIPFGRLAVSLIATIVPIFIGIFIHHKNIKVAKFMSRILIALTGLSMLSVLIVKLITQKVPLMIRWRQVVVACLLPLTASFLSFLIASLPFLNLNSSIRKAMALETGFQNAQLSFAVVMLIAVGQYEYLLFQMLIFTMLYYTFQIIYSVLAIVLYQCLKRFGYVKVEKTSIIANKDSFGTNRECVDSGNSTKIMNKTYEMNLLEDV